MILQSLLAQVQSSGGLDTAMLDNDKLFVVLAVVLIIWAGLILFVYRTDRKIDRMERRIQTLASSRN